MASSDEPTSSLQISSLQPHSDSLSFRADDADSIYLDNNSLAKPAELRNDGSFHTEESSPDTSMAVEGGSDDDTNEGLSLPSFGAFSLGAQSLGQVRGTAETELPRNTQGTEMQPESSQFPTATFTQQPASILSGAFGQDSSLSDPKSLMSHPPTMKGQHKGTPIDEESSLNSRQSFDGRSHLNAHTEYRLNGSVDQYQDSHMDRLHALPDTKHPVFAQPSADITAEPADSSLKFRDLNLPNTSENQEADMVMSSNRESEVLPETNQDSLEKFKTSNVKLNLPEVQVGDSKSPRKSEVLPKANVGLLEKSVVKSVGELLVLPEMQEEDAKMKDNNTPFAEEAMQSIKKTIDESEDTPKPGTGSADSQPQIDAVQSMAALPDVAPTSVSSEKQAGDMSQNGGNQIAPPVPSRNARGRQSTSPAPTTRQVDNISQDMHNRNQTTAAVTNLRPNETSERQRPMPNERRISNQRLAQQETSQGAKAPIRHTISEGTDKYSIPPRRTEQAFSADTFSASDPSRVASSRMESLQSINRGSLFSDAKILNISEKSDADKLDLADDCADMGRKRHNQGRTTLAVEHYLTSFVYRSLVEATDPVSEMKWKQDFIGVGKACLKGAKYAQALEWFELAEREPSVTAEDISNIQELKVQAYDSLRQHERAQELEE